MGAFGTAATTTVAGEVTAAAVGTALVPAAASVATTGATAISVGSTAASVGTGAALAPFWTAAAAIGPVGWIGGGLVVVGATRASAGHEDYSWDCWKQVVREDERGPSEGLPLLDLLVDPRLQASARGNSSIYVVNAWRELFQIAPVLLPWGQVAGHAVPVSPCSVGDLGCQWPRRQLHLKRNTAPCLRDDREEACDIHVLL